MNLVPLWSDILLWLSFCLMVLATYGIRGNTELRQKWALIFKKPIAVVGFIIFCLYLAIALLDSIHLRYPQQANYVSILDKILTTPLHSSEQTYSAPLSYQSFSQSYLEDGSRGFAPLKYAGVGIDNASARLSHLGELSVVAFGLWLLVNIILLPLIYWLKPQYLKQKTARMVLISLSVLLLLLIWIGYFLPHYHLFGTDKAGIDVFYKAVKSIRTSLIFGLVTTLIATPIAIFFGLLAGYFKGRVDDIIQFFYTTINAVPNILLIAALVVMVQVYITQNADIFDGAQSRADVKLLLLCLVIALTSWTGLCRIIRAETLKLSHLEFVQAAQIFGLGHLKILWRHLLPNVMHLVMISMVLDFSALVLTESVLSYIGIGVDSSMYSWGNMINGARLELAKTPIVWWSLGASFLLMFILVLAVNLFADEVREIFDPKSH